MGREIWYGPESDTLYWDIGFDEVGEWLRPAFEYRHAERVLAVRLSLGCGRHWGGGSKKLMTEYAKQPDGVWRNTSIRRYVPFYNFKI